MLQLAKRVYFAIAILIGLLIIVKSIDYFNPDFTSGFLIGKQAIFPYYRFFLYAHIIGAPVALITGIFQFAITRSKFHRQFGALYVASVLLIAAPGAFGMSFFSIGGVGSAINFLLMSVLWFLFTLKAYNHIRHGAVEHHKSMMTRSFILTNSAILIRVLSYLNVQFQMVEVELGYIIISWLSWLPALVAYELISSKERLDKVREIKA